MSASVHALSTLQQRIALPLAAQHAPNVALSARYVYPLQGAGKNEPLSSAQRADLRVRPDAWTLSVGMRPALVCGEKISPASSRSIITLRTEAGDRFCGRMREMVREPTGSPVAR